METDPHKNGCTFDDLSNLCASQFFFAYDPTSAASYLPTLKGAIWALAHGLLWRRTTCLRPKIRTACDFSNYICCPCKTIAFKIHNQNLHEYHLSFPESRGMSLPRMAGSFNTYLVVVAICNGQAYYKLVELHVHVYPVHV